MAQKLTVKVCGLETVVVPQNPIKYEYEVGTGEKLIELDGFTSSDSDYPIIKFELLS